jgi:hypothetical protein
MSVFAEAKTPKPWQDTTYEELCQGKYSPEQLTHIEGTPHFNLGLRSRLLEVMASCYFMQREPAPCTKMCDYWLQMNPQCVGALLLRAKVLKL